MSSSFQYIYKTEPHPHQRRIFTESLFRESVSLFLGVGTGKTKIIIDQASCLYQLGKIDALVVVAPNGVHLNWQRDEMPVHMPDMVYEQMRSLAYFSNKASNKSFQREQQELLDHKGLSVLVVSYEACITETYKKWFKKFITKRKVMMVLDESHRIKGSTSKVKTTLVAMGQYAKYRRALTGSPVEKPPDIFSQIKFLDRTFWQRKGFPTKAEFDNYFCVYEDRKFGSRQFKQVVGYRNIEKLAEWTAETGYCMTLEDTGIVLPPITFSKRYHSITGEQKRVYNELRDECKTILASGEELEAEMAMTKLLRLQQIICGYVSCDQEQPLVRINPDGKNPRLELAVDDILLELPHQAIVWARFTEDINQLMDALGNKAVRYDGQCDDEDRARAKKSFQAGDAQFIVMSDAGAEGHTLVGAQTTLFFSSCFKQIRRTQKLARNYRIGQNKPVHVIDIVCEGTVDEKIIQALRDKKELADIITGTKNGLAKFI